MTKSVCKIKDCTNPAQELLLPCTDHLGHHSMYAPAMQMVGREPVVCVCGNLIGDVPKDRVSSSQDGAMCGDCVKSLYKTIRGKND